LGASPGAGAAACIERSIAVSSSIILASPSYVLTAADLLSFDKQHATKKAARLCCHVAMEVYPFPILVMLRVHVGGVGDGQTVQQHVDDGLGVPSMAALTQGHLVLAHESGS